MGSEMCIRDRTSKQFDELHRTIETSVENFDFNQADNYNVEMGMEYDN